MSNNTEKKLEQIKARIRDTREKFMSKQSAIYNNSEIRAQNEDVIAAAQAAWDEYNKACDEILRFTEENLGNKNG